METTTGTLQQQNLKIMIDIRMTNGLHILCRGNELQPTENIDCKSGDAMLSVTVVTRPGVWLRCITPIGKQSKNGY